MSESVQNLVSLQRRFVVSPGVSQEWFEGLCTFLTSNNGSGLSVRCYARIESDIDNQIVFLNLEEWRQYALNNWSEIVESEFWSSDGSIRRALCDHRRNQLLLEVAAKNLDLVESYLTEHEKALKLKRSPPQPYRYRQSAADFVIGRWRPSAFADGVDNIAKLLGGEPAIREAYVKTFAGDIERLSPFFNRSKLVEFIRGGASQFGEAVIVMEGKGQAVGVRVNSDHKLLRIRTSLPPEKLGPIIDAWPESLELNPTKAIDTGSADITGGTTAPVEKSWLKYGVPVLIAFITAASISSLVTLKNLAWPEYRIVVTSPAVDHGRATVTGPSVAFSWYLKPQQSSLRGLRKHDRATLRVISRGVVVKTLIDVLPHTSVDLAPGDYTIEIDSAEAEPQTIVLHVSNQTGGP